MIIEKGIIQEADLKMAEGDVLIEMTEQGSGDGQGN